MILNPEITYWVRLSDFMFIADEKNKKSATQQAHFILNMKAYIPARTEQSWYISARPPSPSDFWKLLFSYLTTKSSSRGSPLARFDFESY